MAKLKRGDRQYNADTNEWEVKKKKEAPKASAPAPKKKTKAAKAKAKPPVPKDRPKKSKEPVKVRVPNQATANASTMGLKGKVADLPSKKKSGITRGGNAGDKTKAGVNRSAFNRKRKAQLGN